MKLLLIKFYLVDKNSLDFDFYDYANFVRFDEYSQISVCNIRIQWSEEIIWP